MRVFVLASLTVVFALAASVIFEIAWPSPPSFPAPASSRRPRKLVWDLSRTRDVSAVGWPADYPSTIWWPGDCEVIEIALPGDHRVDYRGVRPIVYRDGHAVRGFGLGFAGESLSAAHDHALAVMAEWGLDDAASRADLDAWCRRIAGANLDRLASDDRNWGGAKTARGRYPGWGVSIKWTLRDDAPWCVDFGVLLAAPSGPGPATTQQSAGTHQHRD
jgi:hypothetical protein